MSRLRWPSFPRTLLPVGVLALSLCLTLAVTLLLDASARGRDRARFEKRVQATSILLQRRLDAYIALLRGTGGLFSTQHQVTPEEFTDFVRLLQVQTHYPGIQGIGFTRRLPREARAPLERWMRTEGGQPGFRVWPDTGRDELHAILFLEPLDERNQAAVGFDMNSEATRREAMERARDTGMPALSGKVVLKQEIDEEKQSGFLLYVPVYRGGRVPETVEARREALLGYAYSPFRVDDLLASIFGGEHRLGVAFQLYDGPEVERERLLHSSHGPRVLEEAELRTTATLTAAGREWTLDFATLPDFDETDSGHLVLPLLLMGLLVSLALFGVTRAQVRARSEAERSADGLRVALAERGRVEERLREADRRKDEFLAMLAHELRNPLAPVRTAVHLMERKLERGQEVERERQVVERQVQHLGRLVDDLLDVSRVTQGKIHLHTRPLDMVEAAWRVLESVRSFAEGRGHTLRARLPASAVWTEADPVRFEQVLTNLLNNAAKYTPPGGLITLSLEREDGQAVMRVEDTGEGIPPEALEHLFEPFMQVGRTLARSQGGLGLGLTLVKRLVEMHGGRVEARSEGPGRGSVFTVRLPLLSQERVPVAAEVGPASAGREEVPARGRRVLVVDDNVDAAELLAEVLEMDGHEVLRAYDGLEALEQARAFAPEVVLCDIGMPGLDGYEVARRLRRQPAGARLHLMALTGYGQAADRQRAREAGFDVHLVKPVDLEELRARVAQARIPAEPPLPPVPEGRGDAVTASPS